MSIPLINTWPLVGLSKAPSILSNVLFPLPEGPTMDTNSPALTVKLIFLTPIILPAGESQNFEMCLTSNAALLVSLEDFVWAGSDSN